MKINFLPSVFPFVLFGITLDYWTIIHPLLQCLIKGIIVICYLVTYPVIKIRRLKKRQYCPPVTNDILFWSVTQIADKIRTKQISCEEIVSAFITRCKEVNPILNAIVEDNFEEAIIQARIVDEFLKKTDINEMTLKEDMPLLGVPVTVKASIAVKGFSYAIGEVSQKHNKAKEDAPIIANFRQKGAIILLTSNTPEYCMSWETMNYITGRTLNPYDTQRTPGGSSGGEAAIISSAGSVIGIGSDVAGSSRLPAMFCGIFSHKPSSDWISCIGHKPAAKGNWHTFLTMSILTRYAVDIPLILNCIATCEEYKKYLNTKIDIQNIKVYYITDEFSSILSSSIDKEIKVAIRNVAKYLNSTFGCPIKQLKLQNMKYAFEIETTIPIEIDSLETIYNIGDGTKPWKSVFIVFLKRLFKLNSHTWTSVMYGFIYKILNILPSLYYESVMKKREELKKQLQEILGADSVLICPTFSSSAYYHSEIYSKVLNTAYMTIFNVLCLPVIQCPMGLNSKGLPIGLQLVANDKCDNLIIALAREIEQKFGGWQLPPSSKDNGYINSKSEVTRKMNIIKNNNNRDAKK